MRHRLDALEVDIDVQSAGFTTTGRAANRKVVRALERLDIPLVDHQSRLATPEMIDKALIVIGMTRKHVRDVVKLRSAAVEKTFTLKELVTRAEEKGGLGDDESAPDWIKRIHDGREPEEHLGAGSDTDIEDPIGRSTRFFQNTVTEIDDQIKKLIPLWWPELAVEPEPGPKPQSDKL